MPTLASFPADDPVWNTGAANRTTPSGGKQALGWVDSEEIPSAYFNWWMFYVHEYVQHYKTAIVAVNNAKLERDGTNTITGNILPDGDATRSLGANGTRLNNVFADGVNTNNLAVNDNVTTDLIPSPPNSRDLGASTDRWDNLFCNDINVGGTLVSPSGPGGADLGSNALPWDFLRAHSVITDSLICYNNNPVAGSQGDLVKLNQSKNIAACAWVYINGGSFDSVANDFNIDTVDVNGTGDYTVHLQEGVEDDACVLVTTSETANPAVAAADHVAGGSGKDINVKLLDAVSGLAVHRSFSVLVVARPKTPVTTALTP